MIGSNRGHNDKLDAKNLENLPPEMIVQILDSLSSLSDIINLTSTSKKLRKMLVDNSDKNADISAFWLKNLKSYFPKKANDIKSDYAKVCINEYSVLIKELKDLMWTTDGIYRKLNNPVIKKDHGIVLSAVKKNGSALYFAHEDLKKDRKFVLAAVRINGDVLRYAHEDLKKDYGIVLAAVQQCGYALEHAHADLKSVREIVMVAVQQFGCALAYAH